jgi:hypothetical protein
MLEISAALAAIFYLVTGVMVSAVFFRPSGTSAYMYTAGVLCWPMLVIMFVLIMLWELI